MYGSTKPRSRDYSYIHCETCKFCGGWLNKHYTQGPGTYELLMCAKPGFPPVNTWPERGCAYWIEAPEVALGFYD